jgi:hypothetical protein
MREKRKISKVDQFGIAAGLIGLIADFSSLSALSQNPSEESHLTLFNWITVFMLILYSTMIINFFVRRSLFRRFRRRISEFDKIKEIELSILCLTLLVCLPVMTTFFTAALIQYVNYDSSFLYLYEHIFYLFSLSEGFYILLCGVFYGAFLSIYLIYCCHLVLKFFYRVLISSEDSD